MDFSFWGPNHPAMDIGLKRTAILATTAQQIGLDLHALQVASLESRILDLEARNGELRDLLGRAAGGMA